MSARLPIVYVRGYAGPTSGIDKQVDDPFYGFNAGATHVRVGGDGVPLYYQFEGPLLRLMTDEGYELLVRGDQHRYLESAPTGGVKPESLWVYRFYDSAATTFTQQAHKSWFAKLRDDMVDVVEDNVEARGFDLETAAVGLYDFIQLIRDRTGAPQVYLVAHSMGGLVSRSMIQKVSLRADAAGNPRTPARDLVAKLFTYGTPHGGIAFESGALNWAMETFGPAGADIFAPAKMYGYLDKDATWGDRAPKGWDPRVIPEDVFPTSRIFCLVGTDPADYGLSREVVGPKSDGLVQITNAYVRGADRAFVHRSHSGRYGEVNSEEGYQSLRRFLFGSYRVRANLCAVQLPETDQQGVVWQADVRLSVRGLPVILHEQTAAHYCPVQLNEELDQHREDDADAPVPLATVYLLDASHFHGASTPSTPRCRYTLTMRIYHLVEERGHFSFSTHLEQVADWEDVLIVDVGRRDDEPEGTLRAWAAWNSEVAGPIDSFDPVTMGVHGGTEAAFVADGDELRSEIPLPATARAFLGSRAGLRLSLQHVGQPGAEPPQVVHLDAVTPARSGAAG